MIRLRLLADDLTGALDSAARFVPLSGPVATTWRPQDAAGSAAFDAGTRDLPEAEARAAIARFAPLLAGGDPAFKKIDSLLRGYVALELAECARGFDHCIVAPAFPFQGRITRNGRQWVRDDPGWRDTGVDLEAALHAHGIAAQVCDAESDADLDAIVAAGRRLPGRVLWCGTGGLAGALAGPGTVPRPTLPAPMLALFGSNHPISLAQLAAASQHHHRLPDASNEAVLESLSKGAAFLSVEVPTETPHRQARGRIIRHFLQLLSEIERRSPARPGTLVITGGETLRALCDGLGAVRLDVDGEIEPGVPTSILRGGAWEGQRIVSKSGAFGNAGFLARVANLTQAPAG